MHPKDNEIFPVGTIVRLKKTGEFALIERHIFLMNNTNFLHYEGQIEGRETTPGQYWALYHDEVDLEALPNEEKKEI